MKMKNTTYKLNAFGKSYELGLHVSKYDIGRRTYLGLFDTNNGELFADLSENHPEISDDLIYNNLPGHEAIVIDNDFISCFPSERECKIWIRDNIPECVITGDLEGRPVFYIKQTSTQGN